MIIECSSCHSRYQYDEQRFAGKPAKKIKCARCQNVFEIFNPATAPPSATALPPASGEDVGERTSTRRPPRLMTIEEPIPQPVEPPPGPSSALAMPHGKRLSLAIIDGPDAGSVFRMEKPRVTIGRQGADLTLNDVDASRQHAAVEVRETAYSLVDLQSTNGTLMDGQKINGRVELQNHSEFQVGSSMLMLIVTDET